MKVMADMTLILVYDADFTFITKRIVNIILSDEMISWYFLVIAKTSLNLMATRVWSRGWRGRPPRTTTEEVRVKSLHYTLIDKFLWENPLTLGSADKVWQFQILFTQRDPLLYIIRYGLVVRISGSHPGGPGSIPGNGNHLFLFPFDRVRVLLTTGLPKGGGEGTRLTKLQSATGWPRMKRAPHSKRKVEAASTRKNCKNFDEDGIRTHAGRAHWISSPTP